MSLVTLGDKAKVLQMIGSSMLKRDRLLLSLAGLTSWTGAQRELIETMWNERQQKNKEADHASRI